VELGYARVSTAERDLQRQIEALTAAGVGVDRIFVDTKVGVSVDRPGWRAVRELAGPGHVVVVHTLDRLVLSRPCGRARSGLKLGGGCPLTSLPP